MMDSSQESRETPISTRWENDRRPRPGAGRAQLLLDALEALLRSAHDPFAIAFKAMRDVLAFERAMVLAPTDENSIHCIAALPEKLVGRRWAAGETAADLESLSGRIFCGKPASTPDQVRGRLFPENAPGPTTCSNHEPDGCWNLPRDLIEPAQPALYLPIESHGRRGLLILSRAVGDYDFALDEVAIAREFALLASAALMLRQSKEVEAESRHLRNLAD